MLRVPSSLLFGGTVGAAAFALACAMPAGPTSEHIPPQTEAVYVPVKQDIASVSGFVWDPEAFWYSLAMCGQDCPLPPIQLPDTPLFERSVVNGSMVGLIDPTVGEPTFMARQPTDPAGIWATTKVTSRPGPPFFALSIPPAPDVVPLKEAGPPGLIPPVPPAGYLPTVTLKPIVTRYTNCMGQGAGAVSTGGVLDAVARLRTLMGEPTHAGDFVDPSKFGGVAVVWLYMPGPPVLRVPAFGTVIEAGAGTVYYMDWIPPMVPLPQPASQLRSDRGFIVSEEPVAKFGVAVITLPPLMGPPEPVQINIVDPVTDENQQRPWSFPPLPPMIIAPGAISFLELQGLVPNSPPPPEWVCLY